MPRESYKKNKDIKNANSLCPENLDCDPVTNVASMYQIKKPIAIKKICLIPVQLLDSAYFRVSKDLIYQSISASNLRILTFLGGNHDPARNNRSNI